MAFFDHINNSFSYEILNLNSTLTFSDYNECLSADENDCHEEALCTNTNGEGSYTCECVGGFVGDGFHCQGMVHILYLWEKNLSDKNQQTCGWVTK